MPGIYNYLFFYLLRRKCLCENLFFLNVYTFWFLPYWTHKFQLQAWGILLKFRKFPETSCSATNSCVLTDSIPKYIISNIHKSSVFSLSLFWQKFSCLLDNETRIFSHSSSKKLVGWGICLKICEKNSTYSMYIYPDNWILLRGVILYAGLFYMQYHLIFR